MLNYKKSLEIFSTLCPALISIPPNTKILIISCAPIWVIFQNSVTYAVAASGNIQYVIIPLGPLVVLRCVHTVCDNTTRPSGCVKVCTYSM